MAPCYELRTTAKRSERLFFLFYLASYPATPASKIELMHRVQWHRASHGDLQRNIFPGCSRIAGATSNRALYNHVRNGTAHRNEENRAEATTSRSRNEAKPPVEARTSCWTTSCRRHIIHSHSFTSAEYLKAWHCQTSFLDSHHSFRSIPFSFGNTAPHWYLPFIISKNKKP